MHKHGDMGAAVKAAANILNISGEVLPASINNVNIHATTESGKILNGEEKVSYPGNEKIKDIWLEPSAFIYNDSAKALREADLIVICPGDLYGSILPNFLIKGFSEAIKQSKAKLVYVCNLVTKQGTHGFKVSDFVNEIERSIGKKLDIIIANTKQPEGEIVDKYKAESSYFVQPDLEDARLIKEDLLIEHNSNGKIIARHDSEKIAKIILDLI
jgi:uncharacterized cofD-like protein